MLAQLQHALQSPQGHLSRQFLGPILGPTQSDSACSEGFSGELMWVVCGHTLEMMTGLKHAPQQQFGT